MLPRVQLGELLVQLLVEEELGLGMGLGLDLGWESESVNMLFRRLVVVVI